MKEPKVAIITSTLNQENILKKCLKKFREKTSYKNYRFYFVDDSGKGEIGKKIKKDFKWVKTIINKENLGYSISNNISVRKSIEEYNPDYILHVDDDTEILKKGWLKKLISLAEMKKDGGIFGIRLLHSDKSLQWYSKKEKIYFYKEKGTKLKEDSSIFETQEVNNVIGAFMLIKREVIEKIGFLDEEFSPAYGEETDFCFRASKAGFKLYYFGELEAIHHGSSSSKTIVPEKLWFIKKRNSIRLEFLNHDFFKILKYSSIHILATFFKKEGIPLSKKIKLLTKAYIYNFQRIKEIKKKRKERKCRCRK